MKKFNEYFTIIVCLFGFGIFLLIYGLTLFFVVDFYTHSIVTTATVNKITAENDNCGGNGRYQRSRYLCTRFTVYGTYNTSAEVFPIQLSAGLETGHNQSIYLADYRVGDTFSIIYDSRNPADVYEYTPSDSIKYGIGILIQTASLLFLEINWFIKLIFYFTSTKTIGTITKVVQKNKNNIEVSISYATPQGKYLIVDRTDQIINTGISIPIFYHANTPQRGYTFRQIWFDFLPTLIFVWLLTFGCNLWFTKLIFTVLPTYDILASWLEEGVKWLIGY